MRNKIFILREMSEIRGDNLRLSGIMFVIVNSIIVYIESNCIVKVFYDVIFGK